MTRRLVVTGPESTGKTTLARALAGALGGMWIPEYSRTYAEETPRPLTADDVEPIARGHIAAEDRALLAHPSCLVLDGDLVSTVVYAAHYYGACPPWIEAEARARLGDLYLLCDIDLPWVADGVRDMPHARQDSYARFRDTLARLGANVREVSGLGGRRFEKALSGLRAEG